MSDEQRDELVSMLKRHCVQLTEHFDSVQIICTKQMPDGTGSYRWGEGNWYARMASVEEFVLQGRGRLAPRDDD
jgi:hypothetical protein